MEASFEEKSVWIQLVGMVIGMGAYLAIAGVMLSNGVTTMPAYAALFMVATVGMVILLVVGHIVAAISNRPEKRDERDRLIAWRAEHNSSWVLAAGVFTAITAMVFGIETVWVAHLLLLSMILSEVLGYGLRIIYYRRGI